MFFKKPHHCCQPPRPACHPCGNKELPNMNLPTCKQQLPAIVHPTKHNVVQSTQEYIVPEIHPTHTTHVKNHVYKHIHQFPHSDCVEENVMSEQYCEKPMMQQMPMMAPTNMKPNNVSPMNMKPMAQTNMKPSNVSPMSMKPSSMSPYSGNKK